MISLSLFAFAVGLLTGRWGLEETMHTGPMSESEGVFTQGTMTNRICAKCGKKTIYVQLWESSDGAYEDEKFTCGNCGNVYWVDGIDS